MAVKKLIEVALPLESINAACEREKSIRHGHPSSIHLWWARRPLAVARAVIWASLIDDPSSHPEIFPTEESQRIERERLFKILEGYVVWENSNDEQYISAAKKEIERTLGADIPELLDPFAGGGAIPLEGQRLGLKVHAHDLNPVAVMINKAMLEIPATFAGKPPVNPEARRIPILEGYSDARGLADDVKYYGDYLWKVAYKKVGYLYPKVKVPNKQGGGSATVIAWLWCRTMECPNPACGSTMPLATTFVLSKKKGNEAWAEPYYDGKNLKFRVHKGKCPSDKESPKLGRSAIFKCPVCGQTTEDKYVKEVGQKHKIGNRLMTIVADSDHGRIYIEPDDEQERIAVIPKPENYPDGAVPTNPRWFSPPAFGMENYSDLFTNRQLVTLTTFCDLLNNVRDRVEEDAIAAGLPNDHIPLNAGGNGAKAYSEAISVYLSLIIDQLTNQSSAINGWNTINQQMISVFSRQAMPMVWDHAECNIFSSSSGSFNSLFDRMVKGFELLGKIPKGEASQADAQSDCGLRNVMVSTDPPYYDNIGYADLSDYFYIWMRYNLKSVYPEVFRTMLVPKSEELVATPYHFGGSSEKAKSFFEQGMSETCKQLYQYAREDIPVTIYYAYKQSDNKEGSTSSSGWETMLTAIIESGLSITGTWPVRTETTVKLKANVNALASSIVIVCRKRDKDAPSCTRRNFINELKRELKTSLSKLQESNIAPVDLAQSAIGPGMAIFSKYKQVLDADGTPMSVRSALQIINQELDLYFNEQDSDMDTESRFCVDLYSQSAFNEIPFGDANTLATAKNTSVAIMASHGTLYAQKGKVHLIERPELPTRIDSNESSIWLLCQQLTYKMEKEGIEGCAAAIANMYGSNAERAKDLAYRLYTIAERKKWAQEAYAYNALVVAWPEIQSRAAELKAIVPQQLTLEDFMNNNN